MKYSCESFLQYACDIKFSAESYHFKDTRKMLKLAADRIDQMFWFGILEDLDRSLELLQYQLGASIQVNNFDSSDASRVRNPRGPIIL